MHRARGQLPLLQTAAAYLVARRVMTARPKNTEGCTHLNDAPRALADVRVLVTRPLETV